MHSSSYIYYNQLMIYFISSLSILVVLSSSSLGGTFDGGSGSLGTGVLTWYFLKGSLIRPCLKFCSVLR